MSRAGSIEITAIMKIPSKLEYIDVVRDKIIQAINNVFDVFQKGIPTQGGFFGSFSFGFGTLLAVDEALQNAIIHGNKENEEKLVSVMYYISADSIEITVRDEGNGFDWQKKMEEYEVLKNRIDDPEVKMAFSKGLFLILKVMDEVFFNDKGNEITMIKFKKAEG